MLSKIIFLLGARYRNNLIRERYKFLKESQRWDLNQLESYQYEQCRKLIKWAYNNSRFYKSKFDDLKIHPGDFKKLDDLVKLPTVTKDELLEHASEIQIRKNMQKLFFSETSGSTGQPLIFYRNKEWDAQTRAAMFRGYSWYDVKPWEKNGYFWGYNIDPKKARTIKFLDFLQNRFRVFSYKEDDIKRFAKQLKKATYLEGYSSMIYEVAKIINDIGIEHEINLKLVKGTSEKIFDKYQEATKKAFGRKIVSEYGAAEAGLIAFECPSGNMHINMENVIVEEIDQEILVTNLLSRSFPIIRYKLGDYIKLSGLNECECGMQHHIIEDVLGRVGKVIVGTKHKYPSLTLYYIFKNLAMNQNIVLNYQAEQEKAGFMELNIEQNLGETEKNYLNKEIEKYYNSDLKVVVKQNQTLKREGTKIRDFISSL